MIQILLFLLPAFAATDAPKENPSSVEFRVDGGTANYHSLEFRGKFIIDETFHVVTELAHSRSEGTGSAGTLKLGGGAKFVPVLQGRAAFLAGQEPNQINSFGFNVGLDWTANPRDDSEHETILSLDFTSSTFRQKGNITDVSKRLSQRFLERTWMFSVFQEVTSDFSMHGYGSVSSYPSNISNRLNTTTDQHRRRLADFNSTIAGFQQYSVGIGADLKLSEAWTAGLNLSRSRVYFTDANATSVSPYLEYEFDNDWILGGHFSYTKQDFEDNSYVAGLALTHLF